MNTALSQDREKKIVALVLSGGGAKGAFEMAAEKYAREVKGYQWDIIAGVSVGSLNAVMLAMKKYDKIEEIWTTISNDRVYTGDYRIPNFTKLGFTTIMSWIGLAKPVKSILGNQPLWRKIEQEVFLKDIDPDIRLTIGVVSLSTGKYIAFTPEMAAKDDQTFRRAVLASTSIPIAWPPVDISSEYKELVDGGVRNITPLGDVLKKGAKEIVIINCNSAHPPVVAKPFRDIFSIGFRTIEIITDEVFKTDLREYLKINRLVQEARFHNVELHSEHGKVLDYFDCKIIQPQKPLDDTLNFSQKAVRQSMKKGLEQAQKILGPPANPEQTQRLEAIKARWNIK